MGLDLFISPKRDSEDETLADFVRRRLGVEALDKIAEPLLSGIYNAESERQSLLATFPRFRELEAKHGSLIRGMLASRRARQTHNGQAAPGANGNGAKSQPVSAFVSLKAGTEALVQGLVARLTGALCLNAGVQHIERESDGTYSLFLREGSAIKANALILTTPAYVAAELLQPLAPQTAAGLAAIRYVSTGTISLAFRRAEVAHPLNGFGLVIPRSERRPINAITWTSTKFDHRAPDNAVLLRVFFGGSRNPAAMELDDETLLDVVRGELRSLLGIDAQPLFHRIYRWPRANPQYDVGHLARVDTLESSLPAGIYVAGSPYRGVGIPDCVNQARQVVGRVVEAMSQQG
jgi:oxygen-dependent protoporphyrinogen oxidase